MTPTKGNTLKNLKIGERTHRLLKVRSAELGVTVASLAECLIHYALDHMSEDELVRACSARGADVRRE